jgi:hypothetical protein
MENEAKYCSACGASAYLPQSSNSESSSQNKYSISGEKKNDDSGISLDRVLSLSSIGAGRSFSFMFKDESWARVAIVLGLIMLIPIVGSVVLFGYFVDVAKGASIGKDLPLPRIRFGDQFVSGMRFLIPFSLANIVALSIAAVPIALGVKLLGLHSEVLAIVLFVVGGLFVLVALLYFWCLVPMAVVADEPSLFFSFSKGYKAVRKNAGNLVLFVMLSIVCGVIGSLGAAACYVGLLFTMPIGYIIKAHIAGQMGGLMIRTEEKTDATVDGIGEATTDDWVI